MGFNIAGIVVDRNFNKDLQEFSKAFRIGLEVVEEVTFDRASKNWTPEGEIFIYFSEGATMAFFDHQLAMNKYHLFGANSLCYAYSATAMSFLVSYQDENGGYRFIMEHNHEKKWQEGEPLKQEADHPTADGLIFQLFDDILDVPFNKLDFGAKAYHCRIVPFITT